MQKILIVKMSALGDLLQALPLASKIKDANPSVMIHWICKKQFVSILEEISSIDKVIAFGEKIEETYDFVFDLQGNLKSLWARLFVKAKKKVGCTLPYLAEWPAYFGLTDRISLDPSLDERSRLAMLISPFFALGKERRLFDKLFQPEKKEGFAIMMGIHSRWPAKMANDSFWKELAFELKQNPTISLHIPFNSDMEKERSLSIFGEIKVTFYNSLAISELYREIEKMHLFIGVDSALLHLAKASDTPSIGLFGPSNAHIYHPTGEKRESIQGSCPFNYRFDKRCKKLHSCSAPCMKKITVQNILAFIKEGSLKDLSLCQNRPF